jgi:hypothetical protein
VDAAYDRLYKFPIFPKIGLLKPKLWQITTHDVLQLSFNTNRQRSWLVIDYYILRFAAANLLDGFTLFFPGIIGFTADDFRVPMASVVAPRVRSPYEISARRSRLD